MAVMWALLGKGALLGHRSLENGVCLVFVKESSGGRHAGRVKMF